MSSSKVEKGADHGGYMRGARRAAEMSRTDFGIALGNEAGLPRALSEDEVRTLESRQGGVPQALLQAAGRLGNRPPLPDELAPETDGDRIIADALAENGDLPDVSELLAAETPVTSKPPVDRGLA